jgi:hypothetical protein
VHDWERPLAYVMHDWERPLALRSEVQMKLRDDRGRQDAKPPAFSATTMPPKLAFWRSPRKAGPREEPVATSLLTLPSIQFVARPCCERS